MKKLREKGAIYAEGESPAAATPSATPATPASAKKRKTPAKKATQQDKDDVASPSKKAKKAPKKEDTPVSLKNEGKPSLCSNFFLVQFPVS